MFYNLKIAFRNLRINGLYSTINIVGLAVSLAIAILISLWVWDEVSYDKFHKNGKDICKINPLMYGDIWETTPPALAVNIKNENPDLVDACRSGLVTSDFIEYNGKHFYNLQCLAVDNSFFTMFDFALSSGSSKEPFTDKESIILSENKAKIIFGDRNPVGESINLADLGTFHITGIMKNIPENSSIKADVVFPFSIQQRYYPDSNIDDDWGGYGYKTYVQLAPGTQKKDAEEKMGKLVTKIQYPQGTGDGFRYSLQELTKIHLYDVSGKAAGMEKVKLFSLIAIMLLVIASINYINLITARSGRRSKEMSIRKLLGAKRKKLFLQSMNETFLLYFTALIISICLIYLFLPFYNRLAGKEMIFNLFSLSSLLILGGASLCILLFAGLYPALLMASLKPNEKIRGKSDYHKYLRKSLVVLQFASSIVLITSAITLNVQLNFLRKKDLGYNQEQVFIMPRFGEKRDYQSLKNELLKNPAIESVAAADEDYLTATRQRSGFNWPGKEEDIHFYNFYATPDFAETMKIAMLDGKIPTTADKRYILLNEEALKQMQLDNPVGTIITRGGVEMTIAGVVKNFNFENLNQKIKPLIITCSNNIEDYLYIRTKGGKASDAIQYVNKLWKEAKPGYEFSYHFMDEDFNHKYKTDIQAQQLFNIFTIIAILISCLGLFGLVTYTAETKTKEIGIRKVLGASVLGIVKMLSKEFLLLIIISMLIAFPVAYLWLNRTLENYAYRITIDWWMFAIAGIITLFLALLTVSWKAINAATVNPVNAIKNE